MINILRVTDVLSSFLKTSSDLIDVSLVGSAFHSLGAAT